MSTSAWLPATSASTCLPIPISWPRRRTSRSTLGGRTAASRDGPSGVRAGSAARGRRGNPLDHGGGRLGALPGSAVDRRRGRAWRSATPTPCRSATSTCRTVCWALAGRNGRRRPDARAARALPVDTGPGAASAGSGHISAPKYGPRRGPPDRPAVERYAMNAQPSQKASTRRRSSRAPRCAAPGGRTPRRQETKKPFVSTRCHSSASGGGSVRREQPRRRAARPPRTTHTNTARRVRGCRNVPPGSPSPSCRSYRQKRGSRLSAIRRSRFGRRRSCAAATFRRSSTPSCAAGTGSRTRRACWSRRYEVRAGPSSWPRSRRGRPRRPGPPPPAIAGVRHRGPRLEPGLGRARAERGHGDARPFSSSAARARTRADAFVAA